MESPKQTILVADDDEATRNIIVKFLSKMDYAYLTATDGLDALQKLKGNKFHAVITDIKMPIMDGIDLAMAISRDCPWIPVMITTGYGEEYSVRSAFSVGALEYIQKPFSFFEFSIRLRKMIENSQVLNRAKAENRDEKGVEGLKKELEQALETEGNRHT
jgi:two-component system, cell cycle response regulator CpdR